MRTLKNWRILGLGCLAWAMFGCDGASAGGDATVEGEQDVSTAHPEEQLVWRELPLVTADTPAGYVDFYLGKEVSQEIARTGTFVPRGDVSYSMIRVPESIANLATTNPSPVTVSICDVSLGIVLVSYGVCDFCKTDTQGRNCTPWNEEGDGYMRTVLRSGMPGLLGWVQIGRNEKGEPTAGAVVGGRLPSVCESGGESDQGMILGTRQEDRDLEDPLVDTTCSLDNYPSN